MKLSQLKEARYYGANAPSAQDVYEQYEKAAADFNQKMNAEDIKPGQSSYSPTGALMMDADIHKKFYPGADDTADTHYAGLDIHFHWDVPENEGKKWGERFLNENNLPFTQLDPDNIDTQNETTWILGAYYDIQGFDDKYRT